MILENMGLLLGLCPLESIPPFLKCSPLKDTLAQGCVLMPPAGSFPVPLIPGDKNQAHNVIMFSSGQQCFGHFV